MHEYAVHEITHNGKEDTFLLALEMSVILLDISSSCLMFPAGFIVFFFLLAILR